MSSSTLAAHLSYCHADAALPSEATDEAPPSSTKVEPVPRFRRSLKAENRRKIHCAESDRRALVYFGWQQCLFCSVPHHSGDFSLRSSPFALSAYHKLILLGTWKATTRPSAVHASGGSGGAQLSARCGLQPCANFPVCMHVSM